MTILAVPFFFALGGIAGAIHFLAIARNADIFVRGGPAAKAVALRLGRLLLTLAVLTLATRQGWVALLAAATGVVAARGFVIRRLGSAS